VHGHPRVFARSTEFIPPATPIGVERYGAMSVRTLICVQRYLHENAKLPYIRGYRANTTRLHAEAVTSRSLRLLLLAG
jgi:hypothetical protein